MKIVVYYYDRIVVVIVFRIEISLVHLTFCVLSYRNAKMTRISLEIVEERSAFRFEFGQKLGKNLFAHVNTYQDF